MTVLVLMRLSIISCVQFLISVTVLLLSTMEENWEKCRQVRLMRVEAARHRGSPAQEEKQALEDMLEVVFLL